MDRTNYTTILLLIVFCCYACGQLFEEQSLVTYTRCRYDADCRNMSNNSFCFDNDAGKTGYCKCIDGFDLLSRNRTFFACLEAAGFGQPCEKNLQCQLVLTELAVCDTTCRCADNAHMFSDGKCHASVKLGEFCRSDGNCYMSDGTFGNCVGGRCTCKFDKQVPKEDKMSCIDGRLLGEQCENDSNCELVPEAVCRGSCKCSAGFTISRDGKRCLTAATLFFDPCEENDQCSAFLQGSLCNNGSCTCQDTHHGYGSKCVRTAKMGEQCNGEEECIPHSDYNTYATCMDGTCQCLPGVINATIGCNNSPKIYYSIFIIAACVLSIYKL